MKALVNPSLIPCFLVNASYTSLRASMNEPISISLKVVSRAFSFCDCLSLRAIVWRILLILTLVSYLVPLISVGAFLAVTEVVEELPAYCGAAWVGAAGAAGAGFGGSALAGAGVYGAAYMTYIII